MHVGHHTNLALDPLDSSDSSLTQGSEIRHPVGVTIEVGVAVKRCPLGFLLEQTHGLDILSPHTYQHLLPITNQTPEQR